MNDQLERRFGQTSDNVDAINHSDDWGDCGKADRCREEVR
jgi:hypothetical protein